MAISTSSQTMDAPGLLTRITKRSSAFLKLKPTQPCWPDAEDSTGSFYDTVDGENYWNLKNQDCSAFLKFSQLSKQLASILKKRTEAPTVLARWKAYMIGESAPLCALGILFCCGDTEYLKAAASHISASGAVDESSGVIVRFRSSLPKHNGKLIHLGLGRQGVDFLPGGLGPRDNGPTIWPMEPHVYHTPLPGNQSTEDSHSSTIKALGYSPRCLTVSEVIRPGDAVYVEMVNGIQTATIGGRIECGDQEYFITAAHPFTHQRSEAAKGKERLPPGLKDAGCLYYSSCFNGRPELDYALIRPGEEVSMFGGSSLQSSDSMFALPLFTSEEDFRNLVETTVQTNSASAAEIVGMLDTIPEFLEVPGATELQEVYAAHFKSVLAPGDSGSWVYNAERDILHGHIVAGVPEDGLALIVPAYLVFADLKEAFASMVVQSSKEALPTQNQEKARPTYTPANLTDQNPPCNTLYVGNLPLDTSEDELKAVFSSQRGYKRLCFRTKQDGPMCFVEFEDTSQATEALYAFHGYMLHNSDESEIKLSFSKNPLGVRKTQQVQTESVDVNGRKDFEIEISQKDAKTQAALNSRDPSFSSIGTSVAASPESTSQGFESNVQHSQQASHEISHSGSDMLSRLAFQYYLKAEIPPDIATDVTNEDKMDVLSTWPVFESREQHLQQVPSNEVAFQYRSERAETPVSFDPQDSVLVYPMSISSAHGLPSPPSTISDSSEPIVLYCNVSGCREMFRGNHRMASLNRHIRRKHRGSPGDHPCAEPYCGRAFNRSDSRLKHYRIHHPWLANRPPVPHGPTFAPQTGLRSSTGSDQITGRADAQSFLEAASSVSTTSDHQNLRQPRMTDSSQEQPHSTKSKPSGPESE